MPWFFTLAQLRVIKVKSESGIVKSFGVPAARILKILFEAAPLYAKKRQEVLPLFCSDVAPTGMIW